MQFFALLAFFAVFASRVLALQITVAPMGNVSANQFLDVSDQTVKTNCQDSCAPANTAINACTDDTCLCDTATLTAITACQQCMFNDLIHRFATSDDPRVGSSPALAAYTTACNLSATTAKEFVLAPPSDWNGPFGQGLNTAATAFGVALALFLGIGCITVVNTM
ncbi:hypothetical protein EIP91_009228 [Steccherinum ochraceum]|uniref:Extracellular membrane protein CFEM domain-containing protein n=1 Tax=Steccherinum ochraceum TaxID=92696 RepID=A0A4R0RMY5_9APHY|nr:hypothetical protein EIP91_009228 [Steccherinum ochraceum]